MFEELALADEATPTATHSAMVVVLNRRSLRDPALICPSCLKRGKHKQTFAGGKALASKPAAIRLRSVRISHEKPVLSRNCATEMPRRSDYSICMALETSPRPAPRPITTDLPYGVVDRVEDVVVELSANGDAFLVVNSGYLAALVVVLIVAVIWARRSALHKAIGNAPTTWEPPKPSYSRPERPPSAPARPRVKSPLYPVRSLPVFPVSGKLSGKCYVIDGDTIVIQCTKIRLAGIDAPELDQPFGQKSKWEMVKICKGQVITARLTGERSHDRLVGTCHLPDGSDIGAELVRRGLALDWAMFSGGRYRHLEPPDARNRLMWVRHNI